MPGEPRDADSPESKGTAGTSAVGASATAGAAAVSADASASRAPAAAPGPEPALAQAGRARPARHVANSGPSVVFVDLSWDEYRLLQDKVDRIGDFHFRVKGWLVTLVTGAVVGGFASGIPWWGYLLALVLIFSFWLVDWQQTRIEEGYIARLEELELVLNARRDVRVFQVRSASKHMPAKGSPPSPRSPRHAISIVVRHYGKVKRGVFNNASGIFYLLQVGLVVGVSAVSLVSPPKKPQQLELVRPIQLAPLQVPELRIAGQLAPVGVTLTAADGGMPMVVVSFSGSPSALDAGPTGSDGAPR